MNIEFIANTDRSISLSSLSFNYLDQKGVFDNYQQDTDERSIVILEVADTDAGSLAHDIEVTVNKDNRLSQDVGAKLLKFASWVKESRGFKAYIR